ncbi:putative neural-cadherin 2 [Panulirus ornatus]|uniref:putative neural-cadherin 2 n=1 Tax=Panulirus ornatus TaxID=150431 RepID=UPI003A8A8D46
MAVNVVIPLLIPLEENLHNTTRLLSGAGGGGPLQFAEPRYCLLLVEDAPPAIRVAQVTATHKDGVSVRYSIRAGNRDGLFTIDQRSGLITLAAPLDYELHAKHELVVAAEAGEQTVHTIVHVTVVDVNDNQPYFLEKELQVTVVEEEHAHLPATIAKVVARDPDGVDEEGLVYSVGGDGVDDHSPSDAYFTINPHTGDLLQLRPVDRDPPLGRDTWRVKVQVRDGQRVSPSLAAVSRASRRPRVTQDQYDHSQGSGTVSEASKRPMITHGQYDHSKGSGSSPGLDLVSQDPEVAGGPSLTSHRPGAAERGRYLLLQDVSTPKGRYFLSREPLTPPDALLPEDEEHKDAGRYKVRERPGTRREEAQGTARNGEAGIVYYAGEAGRGRERRKNGKRPGRTQEEILSSSRLQRRRNGSTRKWRAGERRRKLRDKNRRRGKEGMFVSERYKVHGGRKPGGVGKKRLELPDATNGAQVRGRKGHQKLTPDRRDGGDIQMVTQVSGNRREDQGHARVAFRGPRPLRLRYVTHRKRQPINVQRKLLSVRSFLKPETPEPLLQDQVDGEIHEYTTLTDGPGYSISEALHSTTDLNGSEGLEKLQKLRADQHLPAGGPAGTRSASRSGPAPPGGSGSAVASEEGVPGTKTSAATISKREVNQAMPREQRQQKTKQKKPLLEDPRYVKRFGAGAGGCWDLDAFSNGEEEAQTRAQQRLREMRRGRVHVAETVVTVVVKDVNDNAPVFPNVTIYGEVQENGPIDLSACVVWAWDADDQQEGTNARLTYSVEKNVVDERSGQAIFAVNPETGLVRTAVCCLDRETTPEYHIQVVATDGGGLKGTGAVVVRLADVNDNSPRLTRDLWQVEVDETWGSGGASNATLLVVSTADHDTSNYFFYRTPFQGRGGWSDARHTDTAWVEVRLRDLNDNPPQFHLPHAHVTIREDAAPGTLLATLPASDPDMINQQQVHYHVEGGWGALTVDADGGVRLWRTLDREASGGEVGMAKVVAMDGGHPSLSSTATLTITVTDVNDCPPRLLPPTVLHVTEGAPASLLGVLTATDDDVWELGHGPPFNFTLAPTNPVHILNSLSLKYYNSLDSGRGGAEVWTEGPVDREEHRQLMAEVMVADAGGLATTQPITIIIGDVNDNPMRPATKTIYLWKTQGGGVDVALGRVYVEDPDDWDLQDKTFAWAGPPHPHFTLQPSTGDIFASTQLRDGRYELHFSVCDRVWGQKDVAAKVTVLVRYLSPEALAHAIPLTLTPTTPAALATGWTPTHGGGVLGSLTEAVMEVVGRAAEAVEIISVYGNSTPNTLPLSISQRPTSLAVPALLAPQPLSCVWLSMRKTDGNYMDPVKLHGLLALNLQHLEKVMNLRVVVEDTHTINEGNTEAPSGSPISSLLDTTSQQNVASMASVALPLQVVDTNLTSLVTPRLTRAYACRTRTHYGDETCTPTSCLNGGRCVRVDNRNRCVCPGGSWGLQCKVLARTFSGAGWAWVRPLPPCFPITLSLRLLTLHPDALILYSGPLSSAVSHIRSPPLPMVALQLVGGRPQVLVEGMRGSMKLQVNTTLNTGTWHTLHLHFNIQGVTLMVDLCGRGWMSNMTSDAHCIAKAPWIDTHVTESWGSRLPLQLGGLAHQSLRSADFGWSNTLVNQALDGCISHLTVNGELVDLGEPAYSSGSVMGCRPQEIACGYGLASCGLRGHCVDGLNNPRCDCQPGWTGPECSTATVPVAFGQASYLKVAMSFTPDPYEVTLQLRVRARGHPNGLLVQLASSQQSCALELHLRGGVACASVSGAEWSVQEVCVEGFPLGDGSWHMIQVGRHGHNLIISVDDGDGWRQNETLIFQITTTSHGDMQAVVVAPPMPITIDKENGVTLGGIQEFIGLNLVAVHNDFQDGCIDDLRVSGHSLPVAPSVNRTRWGHVMIQENLEQGCSALEPCTNTTCLPPLSCHNSWRHATCSCEPGQQLVGLSCQDLDECMFQPCLHGGTCYNIRPGYYCVCGPTFTGDNCEWAKQPPGMQPLTAPMAVAALTLSILLIVLIGVLLNICLQRSRAARVAVRSRGVEGLTGALDTPVASLCSGSIFGVTRAQGTPMEVKTIIDNPQNLITKEENIMLDSLMIKQTNKQVAVTPVGTKHLVTALRPSTTGDEAIRVVSPQLPGRTVRFLSSEEDKCQLKTNPRRCSVVAAATATRGVVLEHKASILANPQRCSIAAVTATTEGLVLEHRRSIPQMLCSLKTCTTTVCPATTTGVQQVIISPVVRSAPPLLAQDDLRAYAYEGEGSPSGSFASTISGLQRDMLEDNNLRPVLPEYDEVLNLLKNLPDAVNLSTLSQENMESVTKVEKFVTGSKSSKAKQAGSDIT